LHPTAAAAQQQQQQQRRLQQSARSWQRRRRHATSGSAMRQQAPLAAGNEDSKAGWQLAALMLQPPATVPGSIQVSTASSTVGVQFCGNSGSDGVHGRSPTWETRQCNRHLQHAAPATTEAS
jgi:hypothetical protein